jgi:uncharacterized protein (TIGR00251 family)
VAGKIGDHGEKRMNELQITDRPNAIRFEVRVRPRASRSAILGVREGALDVALSAPPVDGKANEELVKTVASALAVARRDVTLVTGERARHQVNEVTGLDRAAVVARLTPPLR